MGHGGAHLGQFLIFHELKALLLPKHVRTGILERHDRPGRRRPPLEQTYVNIPRRSGGRQAPRKTAGPHKNQRPRRSPFKRFLWGVYGLIVALSAVIVGVYIAFRVVVKPPDIAAPDPPVVVDPDPAVTPGSDTSQDNSENALTRREGVYTVLLAATDADGYRTDTMMVMTYDVKNQKVGVVSIPRDTLVDRASGNPKLVYGPGGVKQRAEDISDMLGIPIDRYIQVNIKGFIALVDYLEGVDFYVPCDMDYDDPYQDLFIHFKQGQQHLNGQQAMEVARFRKNNDGSGYTDVGRTQTQQKLLIALAKKVLAWNSVSKINGFVEIFNKYVTTNMELSEMMYFASQAIYLDTATGVETATLEGNGEATWRGYTYCYELDPDTTLDTVNRLLDPYDRDLTAEELHLGTSK